MRTTIEELRIVAQGAVGTAVQAVGRVLFVLLVLAQKVDADGQLVLQEVLIVVERLAVGTIGAVAEIDGTECPVLGRFRRRVDDAGRAAHAEEDGVGTALHINAVHIVTIPRDVRHEEITRIIGRRKAADTRIAVRIRQIAIRLSLATRNTTEVTLHTTDFSIRRVHEQGLVIDRTRILQEFRSDNGDGGTDVLQLGVDAGTGQGLRGYVTLIGLGAHLERAEFNDLFFGASRRDRARRRGILRLSLSLGDNGAKHGCCNGMQHHHPTPASCTYDWVCH